VPIGRNARMRLAQKRFVRRFSLFDQMIADVRPFISSRSKSAKRRHVIVVPKAAYEIACEAANRPSWIGVPLAGLAARLTGRILQRNRLDLCSGRLIDEGPSAIP
jgi:hypothetical protein